MCCGGPNSSTANKKKMQQQQDMLPEIRSDPSRLKLVLLGDAGVGKTCIIQRYVSDTFSVTSAHFVLTVSYFEDMQWLKELGNYLSRLEMKNCINKICIYN